MTVTMFLAMRRIYSIFLWANGIFVGTAIMQRRTAWRNLKNYEDSLTGERRKERLYILMGHRQAFEKIMKGE